MFSFFKLIPLKDWLLIAAALSLLGLGFYAKYIIDDRHKLQEQAKELKAENSQLNTFLIKLSEDKAAIEKGKSRAISRIRKNQTNDIVPPAIADAVHGLYNAPDNITH